MGKSSKSGDDDFPLGKEFLDGISRAHADFVDDYNSGGYDSDDDEGFDEEEGAPASYPANNGGNPVMIDIMEEHCRTFFPVTRIDGKRVEAVCGRPTKDCLRHCLSRRPDRCAPAGRYVRVETKRNLAVGSVDEGVRPFSESSDEESAGEIAENPAAKSEESPHLLFGLSRAPQGERVIATNDRELQLHEENGFEVEREFDSTFEGQVKAIEWKSQAPYHPVPKAPPPTESPGFFDQVKNGLRDRF